MKKIIGLILFIFILLNSAFGQFGSKAVNPSARPAPVVVVETKDATKAPPAPAPQNLNPLKTDAPINLKHKAIREHFNIIKLVEQHKHVQAQVIQRQIEKHAAKFTEAQKNKLGGALMALGKIEDVVEIYLPHYDKFFGLEDMVSLNEQFSTPLGQKYISSLPEIQKGAAVGLREWSAAYEEKLEAFLVNLKLKAREEDEAKEKIAPPKVIAPTAAPDVAPVPTSPPMVEMPKLDPVPTAPPVPSALPAQTLPGPMELKK